MRRRVPRGVRLGVDVGSVRVGLAVSDPDGLVATPVDTLARDAAAGRDLDRIAREVAERGVLEVLVGLPRSLSGAEGPAAQAARDYAEQLAQRVPVPVRMVDERLSTVAAHRTLRAAGLAGRKQRAVVDQVAAVVLLQSALDAERSGDISDQPLPSYGAGERADQGGRPSRPGRRQRQRRQSQGGGADPDA